MASMTGMVTTTGIFTCASCAKVYGLKIHPFHKNGRVINRACALCLLDREPGRSSTRPRSVPGGSVATRASDAAMIAPSNKAAILMPSVAAHHVGPARPTPSVAICLALRLQLPDHSCVVRR